MKKINWKKGGGTFIAYTTAVIFLVGFIALTLNFYYSVRIKGTMEDAVSSIARDIVVCGNLNDAQAQAQSDIQQYFGDTPIMPLNDIHIYIDYASGSEQEWKKGNFIDVSISAKVAGTVFHKSETKEVSTTIMIENG